MSADSPLDAASLHQAALNYLARYAATQAGLRRVLYRRIDRWAKTQTDPDIATPRAHAETVIERLVKSGAVNDTDFATMRAASLVRGGQSRRSVQARLVAKGVAPALARDATPDDPDSELAAALVMTRRRRIGPYRAAEDADAAVRLKELGRMARAGFSRDIALRALEMTADEAEDRIRDLRR